MPNVLQLRPMPFVLRHLQLTGYFLYIWQSNSSKFEVTVNCHKPFNISIKGPQTFWLVIIIDEPHRNWFCFLNQQGENTQINDVLPVWPWMTNEFSQIQSNHTKYYLVPHKIKFGLECLYLRSPLVKRAGTLMCPWLSKFPPCCPPTVKWCWWDF